ncbi:ATP-binding protein [Streptomyces sp. CRN 30]|uniref:ATP-binding protein n=1 Tax=Streptomyces sp. CRN 30 TaxID=3075613 RepID=UPI002A816233|nr:ATP-binding protein [Streptomyces sp. CRN 30]
MPSPASPALRPLSALAARTQDGAGQLPAGPGQFASPEASRPRDRRAAAVSLCLACDRAGFARARAFTRDTLRDWRLEERTDDAVLVVTELAANAAVHGTAAGDGPAEFRLGLSLEPGVLTLTVSDPGTDAPVPAPADDRSLPEHGRGLRIVDALADVWGWVPGPAPGKTVFARLPARPSP